MNELQMLISEADPGVQSYIGELEEMLELKNGRVNQLEAVVDVTRTYVTDSYKPVCTYDRLRFEAVEVALAALGTVDAPEPLKVGDKVMVYDRYRFAIPLPAVIVRFSDSNDGVEVALSKSNSAQYPIGAYVLVHATQLEVTS